MAAAKKNNYISAELDFAQEQLNTWQSYIKNNPIESIVDRWGRKETAKGGIAMVVTANAETQIKCVQDTLAKYLQLVEVVKKLREVEESKKKNARGEDEVPESMEEE